MHEEYLEMLVLDGKPEKGERKLADDLILVINDMLKPSESGSCDSTILYRIGVMEFAIE